MQSQPYILIKRRELTEKLRERAKALGCREWEDIRPDTDEQYADPYKETGDKTTVILRLWKEGSHGHGLGLRVLPRHESYARPGTWGCRLYPVTWLCWDYVQDSYHGQAMLTGLIPNQIYINKLFAMTMISLMTTAYPKVVYDRTRVPKWDNGIGRAIGVNGGDVTGVARILDPAQVSPQIAQFIELTQEMTQSNLGATSVALGDARPDNTSAIIALQRAAATPNELTRQNLYRSIEELGEIYLDFMAGYYGVRAVQIDPAQEVPGEVLAFAASALPMNAEGLMAVPYDFAGLRDIPMLLKLEAGASAYWSEIASAQTLDNLLAAGHIGIVEYLERIPDEYVTDREGLIKAVKAREGAAGRA